MGTSSRGNDVHRRRPAWTCRRPCRKVRQMNDSWLVKYRRTLGCCSQPISARAIDAANVTCSSNYADRQGSETPGRNELRTSFVSLISHHGVSIEKIARLVGHSSTRTTEVVYRRELRPVITTGAEITDEIFVEG
jgi:hypothetical protein